MDLRSVNGEAAVVGPEVHPTVRAAGIGILTLRTRRNAAGIMVVRRAAIKFAWLLIQPL